MAETTKKIDEAIKTMSDREGKYLTFTLADCEYGISILKIKEIIGMIDVTTVPQTPDYIKGVVNLRGKVIPVVDLRLRFGIEYNEYTDRTCIIVVEMDGVSGTILTGIVVDAVSEVLNIKADDIENTPAFGVKLETEYILGMAKMDHNVSILLDIDRVLTEENKEVLTNVSQNK